MDICIRKNRDFSIILCHKARLKVDKRKKIMWVGAREEHDEEGAKFPCKMCMIILNYQLHNLHFNENCDRNVTQPSIHYFIHFNAYQHGIPFTVFYFPLNVEPAYISFMTSAWHTKQYVSYFYRVKFAQMSNEFIEFKKYNNHNLH